MITDYFSEERQTQRAEAIQELLNNPYLSPWATEFWTRTLKSLSKSESAYRFKMERFRDANKRN